MYVRSSPEPGRLTDGACVWKYSVRLVHYSVVCFWSSSQDGAPSILDVVCLVFVYSDSTLGVYSGKFIFFPLETDCFYDQIVFFGYKVHAPRHLSLLVSFRLRGRRHLQAETTVGSANIN